jgi:hypothetical protein
MKPSMFDLTDAWRVAYPDAHVGFLVMHAVNNPASHPDLEPLKQGLEARLRPGAPSGIRDHVRVVSLLKPEIIVKRDAHEPQPGATAGNSEGAPEMTWPTRSP